MIQIPGRAQTSHAWGSRFNPLTVKQKRNTKDKEIQHRQKNLSNLVHWGGKWIKVSKKTNGFVLLVINSNDLHGYLDLLIGTFLWSSLWFSTQANFSHNNKCWISRGYLHKGSWLEHKNTEGPLLSTKQHLLFPAPPGLPGRGQLSLWLGETTLKGRKPMLFSSLRWRRVRSHTGQSGSEVG